MARSQKTQQDPTGQASNRKSATRALSKRLASIKQFTLRRFKAIPKKRIERRNIVNNQVFYEYDISAQELATLRNDIAAVSNEQLLESQDDPTLLFWYYTSEIERPYRQGTIQEVTVVNRMIDEATAAGIALVALPLVRLDVEAVLNSEAYIQGLLKELNAAVGDIKKLAADTAADMYGVINRGIQAGNSPRTIATAITERFDVSVSRAERIAVTEVNKAYNDAKMNLGEISSKQIGVRSAVLHISALIPTTRPHHAARHGNTYTYQAQLAWWDSGANRINCHCTTQTVLVDRKGQPINKTFQKELKEEKQFFKPQAA